MMTLGLKLNGVGAYLDHPHGAILPWDRRVPMLVYPALLAIQAGKDLYQSKSPEERNKRLRNDAIRMGIPTLATLLATQWLMAADAKAYNTTPAAMAYFKNQKRDIFGAGQTYARQSFQPLKWVAPLLWGRLQPQSKLDAPSAQGVFQSIEAGEKPLDIQVGGVIHAIRQDHHKRLEQIKTKPPEDQRAYLNTLLSQFEALHQHSMEAVVENSLHFKTDKQVLTLPPTLKAKIETQNPRIKSNYDHINTWLNNLPEPHKTATQEALPQFELPQRIAEDLQHVQKKAKDGNEDPLSLIHQVSKRLMRHEIRLALPTNEDLSDFAGAFEGGQFSFKSLKKAMHRTAEEFGKEAAIPFLGVGFASVGSGILAGFLANHLSGQGREKDQDVVKEGIFQYVANIAMCGFGAGAGLTIANALGFTKFRNPLARFATIVGGLGLGIYGGALLATPLSNAVEAQMNQRHPKKTGGSSAGRKLEIADGILHVDDVPTAFSVAGVQALKPWIPPFFLMSGIKTAYGYRNVAPLPLDPLPNDASPCGESSYNTLRASLFSASPNQAPEKDCPPPARIA
ncbi:MAG: hypothetical protein HEQ32_03815 [Vampirovibrio sp.]